MIHTASPAGTEVCIEGVPGVFSVFTLSPIDEGVTFTWQLGQVPIGHIEQLHADVRNIESTASVDAEDFEGSAQLVVWVEEGEKSDSREWSLDHCD